MAGIGRSETGAVLAFVILVMLGLFALTHGVLVASLAELAGSRAAVRELEVSAAAEGALQATLTTPPGPWMDSVVAWDARTVSHGPAGRTETFGIMRRLGPESWLIEGLAQMHSRAPARTARMAWSIDPLTRVTSLQGIVSVGPGALASIPGTVDTSDPTAVVAPMQAGDCDAWLDALNAHYLAHEVPAVATLPDSASPPGLGLLEFADALAAAPVAVAGSGTPAPTEVLGVCLTDEPWGWGDPVRPWRPCGALLPLRAASGDLLVSGGAGQGVLIVDGELTLAAGARYYGLVLSSGALRLEAGSVFEGMALAQGGVYVAEGATLRGSACWAARVLAAQRPALGRFVPLRSVGRVGPL